MFFWKVLTSKLILLGYQSLMVFAMICYNLPLCTIGGTAPNNFLIDVLIESYLQELGPKFPGYKVYNRSLLLVFLHWNDSNFVQELSNLEDK